MQHLYDYRGRMKEKLGGFIDIMYDFNPDAVGGSIPDDNFYYIPPED